MRATAAPSTKLSTLGSVRMACASRLRLRLGAPRGFGEQEGFARQAIREETVTPADSPPPPPHDHQIGKLPVRHLSAISAPTVACPQCVLMVEGRHHIAFVSSAWVRAAA